MKKYIIVTAIILLGISLWAYSTHTQPTVLFGGAGSAGPNSPGTATSTIFQTYTYADWANPSNVEVSDNQYATSNLSATDIKDHAAWMVRGGVIQTVYQGAGDSTYQPGGSTYTTTDTYASIGGSTLLWGGTWTPADINNSGFGFAYGVAANSYANRSYILITTNFGFAIPNTATINGILVEVERSKSSTIAQVDHIRITVYYTTALGSHASVTLTHGAMNIQSNVIIK